MNVVLGATDFVARASEIAAGAGDVFEQFFFDIDVDPLLAVFRTEHNVQQNVG
jgi:hypothetical protein